MASDSCGRTQITAGTERLNIQIKVKKKYLQYAAIIHKMISTWFLTFYKNLKKNYV